MCFPNNLGLDVLMFCANPDRMSRLVGPTCWDLGIVYSVIFWRAHRVSFSEITVYYGHLPTADYLFLYWGNKHKGKDVGTWGLEKILLKHQSF